MGVLFMSIKVLGIAPYKGLGDVLIDLAKDEKASHSSLKSEILGLVLHWQNRPRLKEWILL